MADVLWTVTYIDHAGKPDITMFDDRDAAERCCKVFERLFGNCYLNELPVGPRRNSERKRNGNE